MSDMSSESSSSESLDNSLVLRGPMSLYERMVILLGESDAEKYAKEMEAAACGRLLFDARVRRSNFSIEDLDSILRQFVERMDQLRSVQGVDMRSCVVFGKLAEGFAIFLNDYANKQLKRTERLSRTTYLNLNVREPDGPGPKRKKSNVGMDVIRIPSVHHDLFNPDIRDEYQLRPLNRSLRSLQLRESELMLREAPPSPAVAINVDFGHWDSRDLESPSSFHFERIMADLSDEQPSRPKPLRIPALTVPTSPAPVDNFVPAVDEPFIDDIPEPFPSDDVITPPVGPHPRVRRQDFLPAEVPVADPAPPHPTRHRLLNHVQTDSFADFTGFSRPLMSQNQVRNVAQQRERMTRIGFDEGVDDHAPSNRFLNDIRLPASPIDLVLQSRLLRLIPIEGLDVNEVDEFENLASVPNNRWLSMNRRPRSVRPGPSRPRPPRVPVQDRRTPSFVRDDVPGPAPTVRPSVPIPRPSPVPPNAPVLPGPNMDSVPPTPPHVEDFPDEPTVPDPGPSDPPVYVDTEPPPNDLPVHESESSGQSSSLASTFPDMPFGRDLALVQRLLVVFDNAAPKCFKEIYPPSGPEKVSRTDSARAFQLAAMAHSLRLVRLWQKSKAPMVFPVLSPDPAVFENFFKKPLTQLDILFAAEGDEERDYYAFIAGRNHLDNFQPMASPPGTPASYENIASMTEFMRRFPGSGPPSPGRMVDEETVKGFGLPMNVMRGSRMAMALQTELATY